MHRQRTCTLGLPILENKFLLFKGTNWNQLIGVVLRQLFNYVMISFGLILVLKIHWGMLNEWEIWWYHVNKWYACISLEIKSCVVSNVLTINYSFTFCHSANKKVSFLSNFNNK